MGVSFKAKKKRRKRIHGFLKRQKTREGRKVFSRRRRKKRWRLTV